MRAFASLLGLALGSGLTLAAPRARASDRTSRANDYARLWFRQDVDRSRGQLWLGSNQPIGAVDLALALRVDQHWTGSVDPRDPEASLDKSYRAPTLQFEVGPALTSGGFFVLPQLSLGYDLERGRFAQLAPELVGILQGGPAYSETWLRFSFDSLFQKGAQDDFEARQLLLVALNNHLALGAEVDFVVALGNAPGSALRSVPLGGVLNLSPIAALTLGVFVGYELRPIARQSSLDALTGRLTLTEVW
jgi:hypothetical protein